MIAALGEEASPDRAPDDYVAGFFDWYAEHFDNHLTENLKHTGPQWLPERSVRRDPMAWIT
jgi:predicted TPR repeat methyltransferase